MKHFKKPAYLVILGPSGGGKGTQAEKIEEYFGWKHISMGEIFRVEMKKETDLAKKISKYVNEGKWVPDETTIELLGSVLEKFTDKGFVLDGFPRSATQPALLEKWLKSRDISLDLVLHLDIRPEVIMERRKKVWAEGKSFYEVRRKDETIEAIKSRFAAYEREIEPILDYYEERKILLRVNAERPIEDIFKEIVQLIEKKLV